jgi:nucleoside-diphosphate kinase
MEKTLIIIKPDALQRNLLGEIISRFEKKGLKILGMKMLHISDTQVLDHYAHQKSKPFFDSLKRYIQRSPVIVSVLEGLEAIDTVRLIVGPTCGREADAGSIRGDLSMSGQCNIIHASDSAKAAKEEINRFFNSDELFDYKKIDFEYIYAEDERKKIK